MHNVTCDDNDPSHYLPPTNSWVISVIDVARRSVGHRVTPTLMQLSSFTFTGTVSYSYYPYRKALSQLFFLAFGVAIYFTRLYGLFRGSYTLVTLDKLSPVLLDLRVTLTFHYRKVQNQVQSRVRFGVIRFLRIRSIAFSGQLDMVRLLAVWIRFGVMHFLSAFL